MMYSKKRLLFTAILTLLAHGASNIFCSELTPRDDSEANFVLPVCSAMNSTNIKNPETPSLTQKFLSGNAAVSTLEVLWNTFELSVNVHAIGWKFRSKPALQTAVFLDSLVHLHNLGGVESSTSHLMDGDGLGFLSPLSIIFTNTFSIMVGILKTSAYLDSVATQPGHIKPLSIRIINGVPTVLCTVSFITDSFGHLCEIGSFYHRGGFGVKHLWAVSSAV